MPPTEESASDHLLPTSGGRLLRWTRRLAGTAVVASIAVLLARGASLVAVPVAVMFSCVVTLIVFSHVWWAATIGWHTRRGSIAWRIAWAGYSLAMLVPFAFFFTGNRDFWDQTVPGLGMRWAMVWYGTMVVLVPLSMAFLGSRAILRRLRARPRLEPACDAELSEPQPGTGLASAQMDRREAYGAASGNTLSRRAMLARGAVALPLVITAAAVARSTYQSGRFRIHRVAMKLDRLPDRLRGLTITHISDWHVGRLFTPAHLPAMVDAVNKLKSDIVAVTGDMVDHSIDFLPEATQALAQLEHRHGRFTVLGNHDLIDSPQLLIEQLAQRERGLLMDQHVELLIGGETICLAGLFWSWGERPAGRDPGFAARSAAALAGVDRNQFTIALTHHPHAFDALAERHVDLTLAGHTHGGQVMFTPPGSQTPIGGGSLLFRYIWGEYRLGPSAMYVTSGTGDWFPLRVNAPAEIVQIQLV